MKLEEFAQLTGLTSKTIRYYESIGILPSPQRTPNGYRDYPKASVSHACCFHTPVVDKVRSPGSSEALA